VIGEGGTDLFAQPRLDGTVGGGDEARILLQIDARRLLRRGQEQGAGAVGDFFGEGEEGFGPVGHGSSQRARVWPRKVPARSDLGAAKNSAGVETSTISPRSMKTMRSATERAKPISCVTQTIVMPSRARSVMTSSTSEIISGSSAEVGSSKSITSGFMQSARAIATRCCWPPESWEGYLCAWSGMRTRLRYFIAMASASGVGIRRTSRGASVRFSRTVM